MKHAAAALLVLMLASCASAPSETETPAQSAAGPSAVESPTPSALASFCERSMQVAAAVPLAETNDGKVEGTLTACGSYDEWAAALRLFPEVLGLPSVTDAETELGVQLICPAGSPTPVCSDAAAQGLLPSADG